MNKHTPGPWHAEYFPTIGWDVTHGPSDDPSERFSVIDDLSEANAKLITAAPEMLDLITRFRHWDMLDGTADGPYWKSEIDKVLKKIQ